MQGCVNHSSAKRLCVCVCACVCVCVRACVCVYVCGVAVWVWPGKGLGSSDCVEQCYSFRKEAVFHFAALGENPGEHRVNTQTEQKGAAPAGNRNQNLLATRWPAWSSKVHWFTNHMMGLNKQVKLLLCYRTTTLRRSNTDFAVFYISKQIIRQ